ncbi:dTMP kinase [Niallia taxi]|uniref:dTMP kinase n=1 Tax=Niallia taxi TaxID=2499688 RepID=UPI0015F72C84|nr:dTMP kinase [Niallia taxi]
MLVTLESCEGAGKTLMIKLLEDYLISKGHDVLLTREPGGVKEAEQIRQVILDPNNKAVNGEAECLLYAAGRSINFQVVIKPALEAGNIVLCDRFIDSSLVYQGHARGLGIDEVWNINRFAIGDFMPDLTLYLDVSPEVGLARIYKNKDREINRLDLETLEFHNKVREGYKLLLKKFPERMVEINAELSIDEVFEQIKKVIDQRLQNR